MKINYAHLNEKDHSAIKVSDPLSSRELCQRTHAPIVRSEIFMAAGSFPVFIMRDEESDSYVLTVQFCLEANRNLFLENDIWQSPYVPLDIKRRPFAVTTSLDDNDGESYDVLINLESDLLTDKSSNALYEDGEETVYLRRQKEYLTAIIAGQNDTKNFIDLLEDIGLLAPIEIVLSTDVGTRRVSGLYGIHHGKFSSLSAAEITKLHEQDFLQDCNFMFASYAQVQRLIWMENLVSDRNILSFSIKPAA